MQAVQERRGANTSGGTRDVLPSARERARAIMGLITTYRRTAAHRQGCPASPAACTPCTARHIDQVASVIERGGPLRFVLPAFPGKSPNPAKVLGTRPDMAERQSLAFLDRLCRQIQDLYPAGARIIVCSDGLVFSDLVGIADGDVMIYQRDIQAILRELGADCLETFSLEDVYAGQTVEEKRRRLMREHGEAIEELRAAVRDQQELRSLYCGLTRFLLEDAMRPGISLSKTALQKQSRERAYAVMQRSRAWDCLLAGYFPDAVRLSIHPQACGSRKIGIHLMETADEWLTPWHSVAVRMGDRFRLMKRKHAEMLAAELVVVNGRPSHYIAHRETEVSP